MMTRILTYAFVLGALALPAQAACFADYKAKKDNPLQLHYGVIQIPESACGNKSRAASVIQRRLAKGGWTLLTVLGTFDESGLSGRQASAGAYYLRY